ncbi:hypothetical protein ACJX0J_042181, partial [Zea mays]
MYHLHSPFGSDSPDILHFLKNRFFDFYQIPLGILLKTNTTIHSSNDLASLLRAIFKIIDGKIMIEMKRANFDWKLSITTFVCDKKGVQIIFGHLLLSPIKESILYMVFGTSLYLETKDISDIVIFNNMAIVGVSLGIVIAFCVAIGLYSGYRSDCLLLWILIRNYFKLATRLPDIRLKLTYHHDSSFQDLLIVYINSSPVRRIKA